MDALRFRFLNLCLLLILLSAAKAQAQESPAKGPSKVAALHAPAIWLAQGEPFYPMLPHPFAFDGIDNDGDGCFDLADPDEAGAMALPILDSKEGENQRLEDLLTVFGRLLDVRQCVERNNQLEQCVMEFDPPKQPPTTNGCRATRSLRDFHVCGKLWGTGELRCGPPPAVLHGAPQPAAGLANYKVQDNRGTDKAQVNRDSDLMGIQYWLHYPWDAGHLNDGEHVSVFYWSRTPVLVTDVKAVVGAGHGQHTPNNVLFASTAPSTNQIAPRHLPLHLPFLVELGKHGSAPDLNCDGQFELGVDANDGPFGAWGSRDTMASIGKKIIGPFQGWMSYERDGSGLMIADVNDEGGWRNACPEFTRGRAIIEDVLKSDRHRAVAVSNRRYRLLDSLTFVELDERLKTSFEEVIAYLHDNKAVFWGAGAEPQAVEKCGATRSPGCISAEAWGQMQNWLTYPSKDRGRRDVWTHADFWRPDELSDDFKRDLYDRFALGVSFQSLGRTTDLGVVYRIAGVRFLSESALELAGYCPVQNRSSCRPDVAVSYEMFRTSYTGFYLGAGFHTSDSGTGTAAREEPPDDYPFVFAGVAVAAQLFKRHRLALRLGVQMPILGDRATNPNAYHSRSLPQLQVRASWTFGFFPSTHPLSR